MPKKTNGATAFTMVLTTDLYQALDKFCEAALVKRNALIQRFIKEGLEREGAWPRKGKS